MVTGQLSMNISLDISQTHPLCVMAVAFPIVLGAAWDSDTQVLKNTDLGYLGSPAYQIALDPSVIPYFWREGPTDDMGGVLSPWGPNGADDTLPFTVWSNTSAMAGLYVGLHDTAGHVKKLGVGAAAGRLDGCNTSYCYGIAATHLVAGPALAMEGFKTTSSSSGTTWVLPYSIVLAGVEGWYEGTQIYRDFALASTSWGSSSNLSTRAANHALPPWLLTTPLWVTTSVEPSGIGPACAALAQVLALPTGIDVVVHWYGWNNEIFDTNYPNYTARAGFAAGVAACQATGMRVIPYINGRLFDPRIPDW